MGEQVLIAIANAIESIMVWVFMIVVLVIGIKYKLEWTTSVRSLVTMIVCATFCSMAFSGKIMPKDFMLIVSLITNFYFLVKSRKSDKKEV